MAEFTEVMRQAKRMHDMYSRGGYPCADCPLDCSDGRCMLDFNDKFKPEEVECYIMDWAAEHPEPVYPSWDEVWKNLFPGAKKAPCPRTFFGCECMVDIGCAKCGSRPIPAEIAEKLGILAGKLGIRPKKG